MVREVRDIEYTYKGQTTTISKVVGEFCPACDESVHDAAESERINAMMLDFNKEVNASSVDPAFITATRKKLKLDQREASIIFGGGPNGFSRYENGKTRPPLALIQLFRLLNKHPELLSELHSSKPSSAKKGAKVKLKRRKQCMRR
jgi:HTH-type transcriptional regulator/antitoxin MqsA